MTLTTTTFDGAPEDIFSSVTPRADVPIEFFTRFSKSFFSSDYDAVGNYIFLNKGQETPITEPANPVMTSPLTAVLGAGMEPSSRVMLPGDIHAGWVVPAVETGPTKAVMRASAFGSPEAAALIPSLPAYLEFVQKKARAVDGNILQNTAVTKPFAVYAGFRPTNDAADGSVFVDNLAISGATNVRLLFEYDAGTVGAGAVFCGVLHKTAMGKTAADLAYADIVFGALLRGGIGYSICNGVVLASAAVPNIAGAPSSLQVYSKLFVDYVQPADDRDFTTGQLDATVEVGGVGLNAYDIPVRVDASAAVIAAVCDMDVSSSLSYEWPSYVEVTSYASAFIEGRKSSLNGAFYYAEPPVTSFWTGFKNTRETL